MVTVEGRAAVNGAVVEQAGSLLMSPYEIKGARLRNRIVVSPLCQYSAVDGMPNDWHLVQVGRYAIGGAGTVFVEATAVSPEGRITHGDLGLWSDAHVAPLARIAAFIRSQGATPAIQLGHAGRKGNCRPPWEGYGPLEESDAARGQPIWETVAPSAVSVTDNWVAPRELDHADMARLVSAWQRACERALEAGFGIIELHAAHGYLLHSFLSPVANRRADAYGGDLAGRMRFPLEVVEGMRKAIPEDIPFFVRVSSADEVADGWTLDDTVAFAKELRERGVDVVDCSGGGIGGGSATVNAQPPGLGYQVPYAARVRRETGLRTMAVGLILDAEHAEAILRNGEADLVAIGREAIVNPNWALHAEKVLVENHTYGNWPKQFDWWLTNRAKRLGALGMGHRV